MQELEWKASWSVVGSRKTGIGGKRAEKADINEDRKSHGDKVTNMPSRLSHSVITSTPQHRKQLQNTWACSACTMGYYRPVRPNMCTEINFVRTDPKWFRLPNKQHYMCSFWQQPLSFFWGGGAINTKHHVTFVSQAYTRTRVSVCLGHGSVRKFHGMFSIRPGSSSQRTWQMKTCWSTPKCSNNPLPLPQSSGKRITLCIYVSWSIVSCFCAIVGSGQVRMHVLRHVMHHLPVVNSNRALSLYNRHHLLLWGNSDAFTWPQRRWMLLHNVVSNSKQQKPQWCKVTAFETVRRQSEIKSKSWISVILK